MLTDVLSILAPVMITVATGFAWARHGKRFDGEFVTALVTLVGAPALVFHTLANLLVERAAFGRMVLATLALMAISALLGLVILRVLRLPVRAFLPVLIFPNTGNLGLPLSFLAFGPPGLALAVGIFAVYLVAQFTLGVAIASGTVALGNLVRMPLLWVLPPAIACIVFDVAPPEWVNATAQLLGGMTIPLMLLTLGVSLARLQIGGLRRSLLLAVLRLALGLLPALALVFAFDFDPLSRGVLLLQSSMPTAVFNYLFAVRYGTRPEEVAATVTVSTLMTFAVLPLLLAFVL